MLTSTGGLRIKLGPFKPMIKPMSEGSKPRPGPRTDFKSNDRIKVLSLKAKTRAKNLFQTSDRIND